MNIHRHKHFSSTTIILIVFLAFIFLCSRIPALAEAYIEYCYPVIATILSAVSRWFPFSFLDVFIIAAVVALLISIVLLILKKNTFKNWSRILGFSLLGLLIWFYMAWGISYFRPSFYTRFDIEKQPVDTIFFENLAFRYIDSLNRSYTASIPFNAREINENIEAIYVDLHQQLQLPYPCGYRRTKTTMLEPLMTRMGIAGFFNPFFNEIQVNNYSLPLSYPYTLAHEKAHQMGIASEAECNFYASIVCINSKNELVRYSGYLQTVSYLLSSLRKTSPRAYQRAISSIDTLIIADYRHIREHWQKALNPRLSDVQDKIYDVYLKSNQQPSGIKSYSELTELLVAWESKNLILHHESSKY